MGFVVTTAAAQQFEVEEAAVICDADLVACTLPDKCVLISESMA